ncbi:TPA: hypothetical protein ACRXX2_003551 [Klebsiella pneumoniae]|nr:hypothetical protein [Klebsiella pneumoniae]
MTNNLLTLEQAIQHTDEKAAALSGPCAEQHKQLAEWLRELQERRKADSEPVGYFGRFDPDDADLIDQCSKNVKGAFPLYRHALPAPEYPDVLPCPVLVEPGMRFCKGVKTRLVLDAIQRRAEHYAELEAMTPEARAKYDAGIEAFKAMLPQPAPVVPEKCPAEIRDLIASHSDALFNDDDAQEIWNACRAAMLAAALQEVK